jgi:hypothetical protein
LGIWERLRPGFTDFQGVSLAERIVDDNYRKLRRLAAVLLDLMAYLPTPAASSHLRRALKLDDPRLKLFAILSLLRRGEAVDQDEIECVASSDETRILLWRQLREIKAESLMPERWAEPQHLAVSAFVDWAAHPNELGVPPEDIEIKGTFAVEIDGQDAEMYLLRFREYPKPWVPGEGWMSGIAGPFLNVVELLSPWSDFDPWDSMSPEEHYHKLSHHRTGCDVG